MPKRSALLLLALLACLAPPGRAGPEDGGPTPFARVVVDGDGFVRVPAASLAPLGARADATRVLRGGRPVAVCTGDGVGSDLVYLAHQTARPHSRRAVYELAVGRADRRPLPGVADAPDALPTALRSVRRDAVYGDLAAAEPRVYDEGHRPVWFLTRIDPRSQATLPLDALGAEPGTPQTLWADVYATRPGPVALRASWGGLVLGTVQAPDAAGGKRFEWAVPPGLVPAGPADLKLEDVSPTASPPPPQDVSHGRGTLFVDALHLRGAVAPVVDGRLRVFDAPAAHNLRLEDASDGLPVCWMLVDGEDHPLGSPTVARTPTGFIVEIGDVPPGSRLFASSGARVLDAEAAAPPRDPMADVGRAEHVILATAPLLEGARRLAAHRTRTGIPSAVVDVADVYDHEVHGERDPIAIQAFLRRLEARPDARLRFILLAGDATLDRTDLRDLETIPAVMARTMYNGATPADRLYVRRADEPQLGGPSIGRLPFRTADEMNAYVDRLIRYETEPPAHPTRRLMRFVTSEGRFGGFIDTMIENQFRAILAYQIPPAFDVDVTFASVGSAYLWPPPEFNEKVIEGFNEGCLFLTYVGHGWAQGFDSLHVGPERYRILHLEDVERIASRHTPPIAFVVACTTAIFDRPDDDGIGEALLKRPEGPIAYWGATRICHPAANSLYGRALARRMAAGRDLRLGEILDAARDEMLDAPPTDDPLRGLLENALGMMFLRGHAGPGVSGSELLQRLKVEAAWLYHLLGDPALRVAFPLEDLAVEASFDEAGTGLDIRLRTPLPDGASVTVALEVPRNGNPARPAKVANPLDPAAFETIRENHRRMNDLGIAETTAVVQDGRAAARFELPKGRPDSEIVVKAWSITGNQVHQGAVRLLPE